MIRQYYLADADAQVQRYTTQSRSIFLAYITSFIVIFCSAASSGSRNLHHLQARSKDDLINTSLEVFVMQDSFMQVRTQVRESSCMVDHESHPHSCPVFVLQKAASSIQIAILAFQSLGIIYGDIGTR